MRKIEPKTMNKTEKMHWGFGVDAIKMMDYELMGYLHEFTALPKDWDDIWQDRDRRDAKRTKITIDLDADVVRFFKGLGPGYQVRINRVLRAFMHFRLAKLIEGPDTMDYVLRPDEVLEKARRKPEWGDTDRMVEEAIEGSAAQKAARSKAAKILGTGARKRVLKCTERPWAKDPLDGPKGRTGRK